MNDTARPARAKPGLVVLTDIGGDPDDQQSMIRLMVFADEFDIEGLIVSASGTPGELKRAITQPDLIRQIVEAYGKALPSLRQHAEGYPPAEDLLARVRSGNPERGPLPALRALRHRRQARSDLPRPLRQTGAGSP